MAKIMLFVGISIILIIVLISLKDNLWSRSQSRRIAPSEEIAPYPEAVAGMEKAQAAADELAMTGSFAEAMHVLLLQSVGELRKRLDISIAASLTSREILYRVPLAIEGRAMFADIIGRVEISHFGSHQPSEADYLACRKSYEALTAILRQGAFP